MASDAWFDFGGTELLNISRTVQLARALGISGVVVQPEAVQWIETTLAQPEYSNITNAPWYDGTFPASAEFAGILPLDVRGLDDSTLESSVTEYLTAGGNTGQQRNATLPLVWSVMLIASTERGAEYGKRWLDKALRGGVVPGTCSGSTLTYFRHADVGAEQVRRFNVATTRSTSITSKRRRACASFWTITFTMTCANPFEYGPESRRVGNLGATPATGAGYLAQGTLTDIETACPEFDYSPVFDPLYPALVLSPTAPDFYPTGWDINPGDTYERRWVRFTGLEPSELDCVPVLKINTTQTARMIRVSVWSGSDPVDSQCGPLFSVILTYLPANIGFYVDGTQEASYLWDGITPSVRRADSIVYGPDAQPVTWSSFSDPSNMYVTLDAFAITPGVYQGGGNVRVDLTLVPKSD